MAYESNMASFRRISDAINYGVQLISLRGRSFPCFFFTKEMGFVLIFYF